MDSGGCDRAKSSEFGVQGSGFVRSSSFSPTEGLELRTNYEPRTLNGPWEPKYSAPLIPSRVVESTLPLRYSTLVACSSEMGPSPVSENSSVSAFIVMVPLALTLSV